MPEETVGRDARPRGTGRPKSLQKKEQIVAAARELFPQHGIAALSMADIAARAGVAKQTLYSHFANKEALFAEVAARVRSTHEPPSATASRSDEADGVDRLLVLTEPDILTALAGLGTYLVNLITDPELAAFRRIVIGDGLPSHWQRVWTADGPNRLRRSLIHDLAIRPELHVEDPELAAEQFLALVTHRAVLDSLNRNDRPADPARAYHVLESCLLFLRGYGAEPPRAR